jgi:hypothetical protein
MGRALRDKGPARERWEQTPGRKGGDPQDPHLEKEKHKDADDQSVAGEEDPGSAEDTLYRRPGKDQLARRL